MLPPSRATTGSRVRTFCPVPLPKGSRPWRDYTICNLLAHRGEPCEQTLQQHLPAKAEQLWVFVEDVKVSPETLRSEVAAARRGREKRCPSTLLSLPCRSLVTLRPPQQQPFLKSKSGQSIRLQPSATPQAKKGDGVRFVIAHSSSI